MKNKIDLKKYIIKSTVVVLIFLVISTLFNLYQYRSYTHEFNNKIDNILMTIQKSYPDVDRNDLMKIINSVDNSENSFLSNYGIDLNKESVVIKNDKLFKLYIVINVLIIFAFSLLIIYLYLRYNIKKDKDLQDITRSIEEINRKNYRLKIDDNTEDELSILKNEIYKTTVMLKEQAENSIKDKVDLKNSLSDISHQLKTPLTSILITLDNLIDNPDMDNNTRDNFIRNIKREIININFLVQSILKLSKLDSSTVKFIREDVLISNLIDESIKNVSTLCDLKSVKVIVNGGIDNKINCDLKWQVEAITNIIKNCIEHSHENSEVKINVYKNSIYTEIIISDSGVGISKKDLPHIFERFYKGSNSSKDSIGIGLALSKKIIESANGSISVDSKESVGTTFKIKYYK